MTDEQIIKALECHSNDYTFCMKCPFTNKEECSCELSRNALDLINRQKAELFHLQNEIDLLVLEKKSISEAWDKSRDTAMGVIKRQDAEIARLKQNLEEAYIDIKEQIAKGKRAVKDFTEFARIAPENPFACKYCVHSVEGGRACLWKEEHEDEEESCLGRHFEYRGMGGES